MFKRLFSTVVLTGLLMAVSSVFAATVKLEPSTTVVNTNGTFTVDMLLDADDTEGTIPGTYIGQVILEYDPILVGFVGMSAFALNPGASFAPLLALYPAAPPPDPVPSFEHDSGTIAFGFSGLMDDDGDDLDILIGTFTFSAESTAGLAEFFTEDADSLNSFFNTVPANSPLFADFEGTEVTITAIPLPAAIWLMFGGLGLLGFVGRRKQQL